MNITAYRNDVVVVVVGVAVQLIQTESLFV